MSTREPDWKSEPGEGMLNCMYLSEGTEAGTVDVKVTVLKPGCDAWSETVTVHSTLEHVRQAAAALGPKWVQTREKREDGVYTAKRYMPIPGCIEVVAWRLIHTDVKMDGSMFKIDDSLKVQKLT